MHRVPTPDDREGRLVEAVLADPVLHTALHWIWSGICEPGVDLEVVRTERLVSEVGVEAVGDLRAALELFRSLRLGLDDGFDHDAHWSAALASGVAAYECARFLGVDRPEECFVPALLADVGKPALAAARARGEADADEAAARERVLAAAGLDKDRLGRLRSLLHRDSVELGDLLATVVVADAALRTQLWPRLVAYRGRLELGNGPFNELGDRVVNAWWAWGDLLVVPTRTVPGFDEISDWNERGIQPVRFHPASAGLDSGRRGSTVDVLVVEPDADAAQELAAVLAAAGHSTEFATSAQGALERVCALTPRSVVCAVGPRAPEGLEFCRALRRTEFGRRTHLLARLEAFDADHLAEVQAAGVDDFVARDAGVEELVARASKVDAFEARWREIDADMGIVRSHCRHGRVVATDLREGLMTDPLTGLRNRAYVEKHLAERWAQSGRSGSPLSVVLFDIDHFKRVNDGHGHLVGDEVLRRVTEVVRKVTRCSETPCRIGGEEFLVICEDTDLQGATECAERLRRAVGSHPYRVGSFDETVTLSLGVAERSAVLHASVDDLLAAADEATYAAKAGGRNCTYVWPRLERHEPAERRAAG